MSDNKKIPLHTKAKSRMVEKTKVMYCIANGHDTEVFIYDEDMHLETKPLLYIEDLINSDDFVRIADGTLVNIHHIKEFNELKCPEAVMTDGKVLKFSERRKHLKKEIEKRLSR